MNPEKETWILDFWRKRNNDNKKKVNAHGRGRTSVLSNIVRRLLSDQRSTNRAIADLLIMSKF